MDNHQEYYGVASTPTSDYLAHYGIKGMKWGVRKAIERGSDRKLRKQYMKAEKKLSKLQDRANSQHQMNIAKAAQRDRRLSAGVGAASIGIAAGRTGASMLNAYQMAKKTGIGYGNIYLPTGAAVAAGSMLANSVRRNRAIKRATGEGHRKAVKEEQTFRNEMKKAFKGTQYANQIGKRANQLSNKHQARTISYLSENDRRALAKSTNSKKKRGKNNVRA